jgi:nicotinate-nucleotide pyrophosphorylase (carboxylating)
MSPLVPLPPVMFEPLVRAALLEDMGQAGDLTTTAVTPKNLRALVVLASRQEGIVAGIDLARSAFQLIDPTLKMDIMQPDGRKVAKGEIIATVSGHANAILTAERTALNFLCHLSGIATATAGLVAAVRGHRACICCTRKTTPGLRAVEKYAVRVGGGSNHRFGLCDAILIKDNHIAVAGGIQSAMERVRENLGHLVKIEIEVDTLEQLEEAMRYSPDAVLLDNMSLEDVRKSVALVAGRAKTEASGGITIETAPAIAATGVDIISVGWLTHSAPILDIGMDYRS